MSRVTDKPELKEQGLEKSKVWLKVAVALPVAIAAGFLATAKIEQLRKLTSSVSVAPTIKSISAVGRLEPRGEVIRIAAPNSGLSARVQQLLVREGQRVQQGQVIAILDSRDTNMAAVEEAKAKLQESRANLAQIKAVSPRDIQAQTAIIARLQAQLSGESNAQQATIARIAAELSGEKNAQQAGIKRLEAELRGQRDGLRATIAKIQAEQRDAQVDAGRYEFLYKEGAISQQERDTRRLRAATANQQLRETQASLRQALGTLQQQITQARATQIQTIATLQQQLIEATATRNKTLATLQKQIDEERARLSRFLDVRPIDIQIAQAQVSNAIAFVKKAQAELQLSYVKAPTQGEILKVYTKSGEVMNANGIAEIGQTDQMFVVAEIAEDSIGKIRVGQIATITSDNGAFEKELKGTITQIGRKIGKKDVLNTDPAADIDARVVEVKIALSPADSQRVSGLTNAKVIVEINTNGVTDGQ
ncbi:biotin/lipoyl-binding protein [Anabaena cylindrica FACHB-243]|uniref:ABC exporter membrane fusion protein, DevB family n=1 Tax=Anabaena cylindrica (strain ATCC 27899 / PCC 7122) TaxID=272123 RepID=K9ZKS2_ANACC|nr:MULTISPECIES: HlyD family efflux transporter periplasmic adaptor subunit [Anabaena]AFZ59838.1 ABC exporter membrane fusion protein, DevB family [Anabaena cylindrica PCC 7122]MBD2417237.1 biotin/lipoyl-binding protein [Anabaena cylindrica FACHB-243]MBY5282321.1 biotin/lipoyl-binding protein [Anabaena sp. CCAP 1446/1C]MBY5309753.1 biotin/lipoyl-binding protein [Anabaena sp. CCAP 1446/1C]MCM2404947.1 biotin/lipoyl-binding protein [Anabaena sp. CCAP 1446/1C]